MYYRGSDGHDIYLKMRNGLELTGAMSIAPETLDLLAVNLDMSPVNREFIGIVTVL